MKRQNLPLAAVAMVTAAALLQGCGGDDPDASATPPTTTPTSTEPPGDRFADGEHFAFVTGFRDDAGTTIVEMDVAEFLTGDAADTAAAEDGVVQPGEPIENDFYIRNPVSDSVALPVPAGAVVLVVDCSGGCETVAGDLATLRAQATPIPLWVTIEGGVVTEVEQQYLP